MWSEKGPSKPCRRLPVWPLHITPGASSGGISVRQRPGEARGSANESCRRGSREISQKPSVFSLDEIFANDKFHRIYRPPLTALTRNPDPLAKSMPPLVLL